MHWPEDSEGNFWSSSQAAICPPIYRTRWRFHAVPFYCQTSSRILVNINFYSLWFDPHGNRTRVYRFTSRRSICSTSDRLKLYALSNLERSLFFFRNKFNFYIMSLCLSDLISAALSPFGLYQRTWGFTSFNLPSTICKVFSELLLWKESLFAY